MEHMTQDEQDRLDRKTIAEYLAAQIVVLVEVFGYSGGCVRSEMANLVQHDVVWDNLEEMLKSMGEAGGAMAKRIASRGAKLFSSAKRERDTSTGPRPLVESANIKAPSRRNNGGTIMSETQR